MKYKDRVIFGLVALVGLMISSGAFAQCSVTNWSPDGTEDANINPNSGVGTPAGVSRFSGSCGLEVENASWVESHHSSDAVYIARFYVLPELSSGSGTVDLLIGHDSDTVDGTNTELFKVSYDGTNFIFDVSGAHGSPATVGTFAALSGWNLVEIKYDDGNDTFEYWVNETWDFNAEDYTTGPSGTLTETISGVVEAVQLGAPNGMASQVGTFTFDAFEAHRTTPVGALLNCDATADGNVSIADVLNTLNEVNTATLAAGQPDCTRDGNVSIADVLSTLNVVNTGG